MNRLSFLDKKVDQLGFVVRDVDEAVRNYYDFFGIGDWKIYTYGPPILSYMTRNGAPASYKARIALSYFGESRIELIQNLEGDTVYSEFTRLHGYGVHHLGIYVKDIEAALAEARAGGLRVTMEGAGFGLDGDGHFAYLDTEERFGTTYELIQRPLRRREPEAVFPPV
ncbi:MAG: VOC family protein [Treponema sp.]|jgi:catechol 2,3-dioxygenase-like lactoylglutathione lyase family enzyme|nr:VOC family protein [Treponema sp.]